MNAQGIIGTNSGIGKFFAEIFKPSKLSSTKDKRNLILLGIAAVLSGILLLTGYVFSTERQADIGGKQSLNPRLVDQQGTSSSNGAGSGNTAGGQTSGSSNSSSNNSSSDNGQSGSASNSTTVTVNGQQVNVPANGTYSATIGNTTVSGSTQQSSDSKGGSVSNSSSNTINVHSQ